MLAVPDLHVSGEGPPVVLLHPLGVHRGFWDPVLPLLARFTTITYDLPGHGDSPDPGAPYEIEDLSDQLAAALQATGIGPAHVVGVSLGGLIAQDFAARFPHLVDRLVLVDTVACYPDPMRAMWRDRAGTARTSGMDSIVPGTLETWFTAACLQASEEIVLRVGAMLADTDPEGYAHACEALAHADTRAQARDIAAPTLVVCGDDDLPAFRTDADWLATAISDVRLAWLSPARHAGVLELPAEFTDALLGFLQPSSG